MLIGAPGPGKGTQAPLIENKFGIPHLLMSDILELEMLNQSELFG